MSQFRRDRRLVPKKRGNGYYYVRYGGKRHTLDTKDERTAKARCNQIERDLFAGKIVPINEGITKNLKAFIEEYLEHIEGSVEASTYKLYDVALRKMVDSLQDMPLKNIETRQLEKVVKDMRVAGLAAPTINKNMRHIKSALKTAWYWYKLPSQRFPKKDTEENELRFLKVEDLRKLIGSITDVEFMDYCLFVGYTGLRTGEVLRLQWQDVDNPAGFLRISPKQKNKKETRIPINAHARTILDRCKNRKLPGLFRFKTVSWVSQKFKAAAVKAGMGGVREHDLRHTFASHLAMAGVDLLSIQELMRHKSIQSTLVYAKVSPDHLKKESEKLDYGLMPVYVSGGNKK